jgi:hypothetical protein
MERLSRIVNKNRPLILPPVAGNKYGAFVDFSSMSGKDSTVLAIAHASEGVTVLDLYMEFKPSDDGSLDDAIDQIAARCKAFGIREVIGDKWALGAIESLLRKAGLKYTPTESLTKSDIYRQFAATLPGRGEPAKIEIPDDARLLFQFLSLRRKVNVHGNETIDAMKDLPEHLRRSITWDR